MPKEGQNPEAGEGPRGFECAPGGGRGGAGPGVLAAAPGSARRGARARCAPARAAAAAAAAAMPILVKAAAGSGTRHQPGRLEPRGPAEWGARRAVESASSERKRLPPQTLARRPGLGAWDKPASSSPGLNREAQVGSQLHSEQLCGLRSRPPGAPAAAAPSRGPRPRQGGSLSLEAALLPGSALEDPQVWAATIRTRQRQWRRPHPRAPTHPHFPREPGPERVSFPALYLREALDELLRLFAPHGAAGVSSTPPKPEPATVPPRLPPPPPPGLHSIGCTVSPTASRSWDCETGAALAAHPSGSRTVDTDRPRRSQVSGASREARMMGTLPSSPPTRET
ncbi:rho GTPase-activating protein 17 [Sorex araneus]|uniref:rho GTPase-activating protein 17 n=1 Tax=Sorex araneus TaxID=42254 RepID=UPI002433B86A|nr:rho GTPase-activating protein 17 [Sorex araneus]